VEIFDARASGAKPDGGLTASQVAKILKELEDERDRRFKAIELATVYGGLTERLSDNQNGMADGISKSLFIIRAELSPQPAEPEIDL
jgi:hypothetical protein